MGKIIKNNSEYSLSFIFPVLNGVMGGVQVLIINLIKYYTSNDCVKIRLYDYKQGLIRSKLIERGVTGYEFISLDYDNNSIPNKGKEIFIMPNGGLLFYPNLFNTLNDTYILIWDVYYPFWYNFYKIKGIPIPGMKMQTMRLLAKKNAIIFMENEGIRIFKKNGISIGDKENKVVFIPVFKSSNRYVCKNILKNKPIQITYIARCVFWKITPIIKLLSDLQLSLNSYEITIVTDNPEKFSNYLSKPVNVVIHYKRDLFGRDLENIILSTDIGIGMGTSALDLAKFGVPTILVNPSLKEIKDNYKYQWLYETEPGQLGQELFYRQKEIKNNGKTWREIENDFNNINDICLFTEEYIDRFHLIEKTAAGLLNNANLTELRPADCRSIQYIVYLWVSKIRRQKKYLRLFEEI